MQQILLTGLMLILTLHASIAQELLTYNDNKEIPATIEKAALTALSHYPELKETTIHFIFTHKLKKSIMAARPTIGSLFKKRQNRSYKVLINPAFKLGHDIESMQQIPDSIMIGWIGHELGHIMDYERKSGWKIMEMAVSYRFSRNYVRKAERIADSFAVEHGLGTYLMVKKSFVLDHTELPQHYKDKIEALYPSPDDIGKWVADMEGEAGREKEGVFASEEESMEETEAEFHEGSQG